MTINIVQSSILDVLQRTYEYIKSSIGAFTNNDYENLSIKAQNLFGLEKGSKK